MWKALKTKKNKNWKLKKIPKINCGHDSLEKETEKKSDGLETVVSSIHVVAHEHVLGVGHCSACKFVEIQGIPIKRTTNQSWTTLANRKTVRECLRKLWLATRRAQRWLPSKDARLACKGIFFFLKNWRK